MENLAKPFNRVFFLLCVLITGSLAGAFVWLFFFLMNKGIAFLWQTVPGWISSLTAESLPVLSQGPFGFVPFPLIVCVLGGLLIGLYTKHTGIEPEDLNVVMAKVKETGRYDYSHIGKLSLAALLPLLFGGSVGPEAGLTGVIAGLCTWVGDRMRRFARTFAPLPLPALRRRSPRCSPLRSMVLLRRFPERPMGLVGKRASLFQRLKKPWCICALSLGL